MTSARFESITPEAYEALTGKKPAKIEGGMIEVWLYLNFYKKMRDMKLPDESLSDVILRFLRDEAAQIEAV